MKLPPVWEDKSTTPVKAKTSAPAAASPTSCAALTGRGLVPATHTGSRERGGGLRQTLERQDLQWGRLTLGRRDATGTAWAAPLEHRLFALARDVAVLSVPTRAGRKGAASTQAAC